MIPWTVVCQAPLSMEFSRQVRILEWVAIPFSRDLPNPGIKPGSSALQADPLPSEPPKVPKYYTYIIKSLGSEEGSDKVMYMKTLRQYFRGKLAGINVQT